MPRSPKSDNSGDDVGDDSLSDENEKMKTPAEQPSPTLSSPKRLVPQPSQGGLAALQLFRTESTGSRRPVMGDPRAYKSQTLEVLTEMISIDQTDPTVVAGFDPRRWIVAAGVLEKRRDGIVREGWAKRFFVLGKNALYYFLLPKTDMSGHTPLLGDERGCIKLIDVQEVSAHARDSNYWYLTVTVVSVRKNNPSQLFNNQVPNIQLRTPAESGQLWLSAIIKARDDARANANAGSSPKPSLHLRKGQNFMSEVDSMTSLHAGDDVPLSTTSQQSMATGSGLEDVKPSLEMSHSQRFRRDSANIRALDLVPLDQSFPLAKSAPFLAVLLIWTLLFVGAYPELVGMERHLPPWFLQIPPWAFACQGLIFLAVYFDISRRVRAHDHVAREAKLRVGVMRDELNTFKKEQAMLSKDAESEKILLPATSSEIAQIQAVCDSIKHAAGSSTKFMSEPMRPGVHYMGWCDATGSDFKLRVGPNYKKNNLKAPSAAPLYTLIALDLFATKDRFSCVGRSDKLDLPAYRPGVDASWEDLKAAGLPRLFIVNAQIPDKFSLVFYFAAKPETVRAALGPNPHPSIKLMKQYVKEHASNPDIRRRFKAIGIADNVKDLGISNLLGLRSLIDKFNGKPVIINKVAQVYESESPQEWFEIDISIHDFPYAAKTGLSAIKDRVSEILLRAGFVFQGESDEELPECLLGGGDMCGLDFRLAKVI